MTPDPDSKYLRDCGWNLPFPFNLALNCKGELRTLVCHEAVRVLPHKRLVCLGRWNDLPVVIKVYLDPKRGNRHCKRELAGIQALQQSAIKIPSFLFMGTLPPDGSPVLVSKQVSPAKTLKEVWEQTTDETRLKDILRQSLRVIAQHHEAGIMQEDPHLGNFLCQGSLHDIPYTIDGAAINAKGLGKPLPKKKSLDNLALFLAQFDPAYDRNLPEILLSYMAHRGWIIDDDITNRLLKKVKKWRKIRRNNYLKKIFRECSAFVCKKRWNRFMVCDRNDYKDEMKKFLNDPDKWIVKSTQLKDGNTSTVSMIEIGGERFVVKRYNIKSPLHGLKRLFRRSRAWLSWKNAHYLRTLKIITPRPVALLEERIGPLRMRAYFICDYVEGPDLLQFFTIKMQPRESEKAQPIFSCTEVGADILTRPCWFSYEKDRLIGKANLIAKTTEMLKQFADFSISHGDFKGTNFIVSGDKVYITDLDSMTVHRFRWKFRKAFKRDCERFMKNWVKLPGIAEGFRTQLSALISQS